MTITLTVDASAIGSMANMLAAVGNRAPVALARALNRVGQPARTAYLRHVRKTLGLKSWRYGGAMSAADVLKRRTSVRRANPANLEYSLVGFGEGFNLKYYSPRETPRGAEVNWLGARKVVPRSFYLGGKFPRRKVSRLTSKGVFVRKGKGRWNIESGKGPGVPEAMGLGSSQSVWIAQAAARLPREISHQLYAILAGFARGTWGR